MTGLEEWSSPCLVASDRDCAGDRIRLMAVLRRNLGEWSWVVEGRGGSWVESLESWMVVGRRSSVEGREVAELLVGASHVRGPSRVSVVQGGGPAAELT